MLGGCLVCNQLETGRRLRTERGEGDPVRFCEHAAPNRLYSARIRLRVERLAMISLYRFRNSTVG